MFYPVLLLLLLVSCAHTAPVPALTLELADPNVGKVMARFVIISPPSGVPVQYTLANQKVRVYVDYPIFNNSLEE